MTLSGAAFTSARRLFGPDQRVDEKNWMPFTVNDTLHFVYSCNPTVILRYDEESGLVSPVEHRTVAELSPSTRGSSQGVALPEGGFLFVVHELYWVNKSRCYLHRLVRLDPELAITEMSERFRFTDTTREFCGGLALRDQTLVISFGRRNTEAFLMVLDLEDALDLLRPVRTG